MRKPPYWISSLADDASSGLLLYPAKGLNAALIKKGIDFCNTVRQVLETSDPTYTREDIRSFLLNHCAALTGTPAADLDLDTAQQLVTKLHALFTSLTAGEVPSNQALEEGVQDINKLADLFYRLDIAHLKIHKEGRGLLLYG